MRMYKKASVIDLCLLCDIRPHLIEIQYGECNYSKHMAYHANALAISRLFES